MERKRTSKRKSGTGREEFEIEERGDEKEGQGGNPGGL